jgi:hypothetical protein
VRPQLDEGGDVWRVFVVLTYAVEIILLDRE